MHDVNRLAEREELSGYSTRNRITSRRIIIPYFIPAHRVHDGGDYRFHFNSSSLGGKSSENVYREMHGYRKVTSTFMDLTIEAVIPMSLINGIRGGTSDGARAHTVGSPAPI